MTTNQTQQKTKTFQDKTCVQTHPFQKNRQDREEKKSKGEELTNLKQVNEGKLVACFFWELSSEEVLTGRHSFQSIGMFL